VTLIKPFCDKKAANCGFFIVQVLMRA